MSEQQVLLDPAALREIVERQGLKQWWIAEQIGVATRTVVRWINGSVRSIAPANLERLARLLGCDASEITASRPQYGTPADQRIAARLLQSQELLYLLSPGDRWELAEALIKAAMAPGLAPADAGRLHNQLSIALWRQGRYREGREQAMIAREIGEAIGERTLRHRADLTLATIDSIEGEMARARSLLADCLATPEAFETEADLAAALSNFGGILREFGELDDARHYQMQALACYERLDRPFNLAIAWIHLTVLETEAGDLDAAERSADHAEEAGRRSGYEKGLAQLKLYRAEIAARKGDIPLALRLVDEGLAGLGTWEVYDLGVHEAAARALRLAGAFDAAEAQFADGLARAARFGQLRSMMLLEGSRIAAAMGRREEAAGRWREAAEWLAAQGMQKRIGPSPEE